jgi:uncharacterized delta-60 repeat protein
VRRTGGSLILDIESSGQSLILGSLSDEVFFVKSSLLILVFLTSLARAQDEVALSSAFGAGEGVNGEVLAIALQPDGKIVIGGRFSAVNGIVRNNIARLNGDGTLDRTFVEGSGQGIEGEVNALAIQAEGSIIVGGTFSQAGQFETENLARYLPDGSIDRSFGGNQVSEHGADGSVYALGMQPDGKILVGGNFETIFGQPRRGIARLNADGTLDTAVTAEHALSGIIRAVAVRPDRSSVVGGQFTLPGQMARNVAQFPGQ